MAQTLKIVFITDIHLNFQNVQKLRKWNQQNFIKFDLCLIGGDVGNCDQNNKTHDQQHQQNLCNNILQQIQQIVNCKMIIIPGNHDPLSYLNSQNKISQNIENCHSKTILMAEGLQLIGLGGSVPGYTDLNRTQKIWNGYPYNSNEQLAQQCEQKRIFHNNTKNQRIFLTHCGPFDYETSIDRRDLKKVIYGGAVYYNDLIKSQNLLMYLHGHVHNGSRYAKVNQIPLINPGGFIYGQFCYIQLQKPQNNAKWNYLSGHFINLSSKHTS